MAEAPGLAAAASLKTPLPSNRRGMCLLLPRAFRPCSGAVGRIQLRVSFPKNVDRAHPSDGMTETIISDPIAGDLRRIDAFSHGRALTVEGREVQAVVETGEGL